MITQATKQKIRDYYISKKKPMINEIENMIIEFTSWFESNCLQECFTEDEKEVIKEWRESGMTFPEINSYNTNFSIEWNRPFNLGRWGLKGLKNLGSEVIKDFLVPSRYIILHLSEIYPHIRGDVKFESIANEKLRDEAIKRAEYIISSIESIMSDLSGICNIINRPEISIDLIKKYSPNLYNGVWKQN